MIERKKRGQGNPTLIYMKKFIGDDIEKLPTQELEQPVTKESEWMQGERVACSEVEKNNFKESEISTPRGRENQLQEVAETDSNKTNINKNNINNTNLIYPINHTKKEKEEKIDTMDR